MIQWNLFTNKNRLTDFENKLMVTKGERWGGRGEINWEVRINIHTLYIKIINKDLLYSSGNSTQYSVITYTGKESKKRMDLCTCN